MSNQDDFISSLSEAEAAQLRRDIDAAKEAVLERRQAARTEELTENYKRDMLAARGNKPLVQRIKARYTAMGCPVDTVDFS